MAELVVVVVWLYFLGLDFEPQQQTAQLQWHTANSKRKPLLSSQKFKTECKQRKRNETKLINAILNHFIFVLLFYIDAIVKLPSTSRKNTQLLASTLNMFLLFSVAVMNMNMNTMYKQRRPTGKRRYTQQSNRIELKSFFYLEFSGINAIHELMSFCNEKRNQLIEWT